MADEAAALIPAVRTDIKLVGADGEENELFTLSGLVLSRNGIFITDYDEIKAAALNKFNLEETDDAAASVTYELFYPNPKETGKFLRIYSQQEIESSVAVFQAALKFRRPQIVRQAVKNNTTVISTCINNAFMNSMSKETKETKETKKTVKEEYKKMNLALHQIWELAMLSTNHKRIFASKINALQCVIDTIQSMPKLNTINSHHVTSVAILWALAFQHDGRNRLLKDEYDVVNVLMDSLIHVKQIEYKKKSEKLKAKAITTTYCAFTVGALLSCTHHGKGLKMIVSRLDDIKHLAFDVTEELKLSLKMSEERNNDYQTSTTDWMNNSNNNAEAQKNKGTLATAPPVWSVSRSSLQDLILFLIGNCVVRKHAQVNIRRLWGNRSKEYQTLKENNASIVATSDGGSSSKTTNNTALASTEQQTSMWVLSDIPKTIVKNSSIRTRLITMSIISEFARDIDGRVVFVNDDQIIGQVCDIAVWGLEWLVKVHPNDTDVNTIHCLREPILESDEDVGLVYRVLEHCALSLWGWSMCACEMMLGNNGTGDGAQTDEMQLKAMTAMTSMADSMSRPSSKKQSRASSREKGGKSRKVMSGLKDLSKSNEPSAMELAMNRVPGILTALADMSNGLNHKMLTQGDQHTSLEDYLATAKAAAAAAAAAASPKSNKSRNRHRLPSDPGTENIKLPIIVQRLHWYGVTYDDLIMQRQQESEQKTEQKPEQKPEQKQPSNELPNKDNAKSTATTTMTKGMLFLESEKHLTNIARIESLGAGCISTIATVKHMAGAILRNGIVPILLKLLFSPGPDAVECRECAASALCLFASGSTEGRKEIFKCGGIDALLNVIAPVPVGGDKETEKNNKKKDHKRKSKQRQQREQEEALKKAALQKKEADKTHDFYKHRASPKLLGFCTEILHREGYLLDDVVLSNKIVRQMVNGLTTVKAPVKFNEETKTWDPTTEHDPLDDWALQTHVACAVWRVGVHKQNAITLGKEGACAALTNMAIPLIYTSGTSDHDCRIEKESEKKEEEKDKEKGGEKNEEINEEKKSNDHENIETTKTNDKEYVLMPTKHLEKMRVSLLDFTILSLWMLSYNGDNCQKMLRDGSIELLISILDIVPHENSFVGYQHNDDMYNDNDDQDTDLSGISYSGLHEFALKCLWVLCSTSVEIARHAVQVGIVRALRRLPIDKMIWGAAVLQVLVFTDKVNRDVISEKYGEDILEQMLIFMMRSNVSSLMSYGALGAARCAMSTSGRYRLVNVPGCLETMFHLLSTTNDQTTQVHTGRALLNLSKSTNIQMQMAAIGLYTLVECSWSPTCEEARIVCNGVLDNLKNNPMNRDLLYRAELHIKSFVENQVKSHYLLKALSSLPHHVQGSLRGIGQRPAVPSTDTNRAGQRQSPLQSVGPVAMKNIKKSAKRRNNYERWIENSGIAGERTALDDLTRGTVRKPTPKYLPTLSQMGHGSKPSFSMLKAEKGCMSKMSATSLLSLPSKHNAPNNNTMYNPMSSTASALPPMMPSKLSHEDEYNNNNNNNTDHHLDQQELPEGLETKLLDEALLLVSGIPQLHRSMRRPMSDMYTSVPPNSSLQPPLHPVHRDWGPPSSSSSSSSFPSTNDLNGLSDEVLHVSIQQCFWERGPMNVTFLKATSRDIRKCLHIKVKGKKKSSKNNAASPIKNTSTKKSIKTRIFEWELQSPAYYWRSMYQETNSFGVQMIVTHQVLLDIDPLPVPPLQLPEGTKDELPPAPKTPGIPQNEPTPFQVPPLGPPVPQKHTLPVDEHVCHCNASHSIDCGWKEYCSLSSSQHQYSERHRFSAKEGGDCGMFGRLRDRHMQYRMTTHRIEKVQIKEEKKEIQWIFSSRLKTSDAKSYFDEDLYPKMCENDWQRVIGQEHFIKFLNSKLKLEEQGMDMTTTLSNIYDCILPHYRHLMWTFEFYSAMGNSSDMSQMLYNQCMDLMGDTDIVEPKNKKMDRSVLDGVFIEANKEGEEQQESEVGDTNADRALMRFELVEMLIRIGLKKYLEPGTCATIDKAVEKILVEHILPNDASGSCSAAIHDIDDFRRNCLYNPDVDVLLRENDKTLRAIFSKFQDEDSKRLKNERMTYTFFMRFLKQVKFINEDFTLREARVTYVWSRMKVIDEVASHGTWGYLNYIDWLEALARMAQLKCVPSPTDLEEMQAKKIIKSKDGNTHYGLLRAWHKESVGNKQGKLLDRASGEWGAPPERPWVEKFQALIDLLFCVFDADGDGVDLDDLYYWKPGK